MLDLTVNRMLLNPDTVAKISDLVNEHEDVQLELIFKLGLDGSSKHPGKFPWSCIPNKRMKLGFDFALAN